MTRTRRRRRAGRAGEPARSRARSTSSRRCSEAPRCCARRCSSGVARIGGRLGELRLDTDLDISHGVVRYLELLKLAALLQRPRGPGARRGAGGHQRAPAGGDDAAAARDPRRPRRSTRALLGGRATRTPPAPPIGFATSTRCAPFLPRKGDGLALSASDIETYRSCPLRYKFARVLRIPTEQTLHQRFGIAVHQVLERYHSERRQTLTQLLELLDAGWRRGGFGRDGDEGELREKARAALDPLPRAAARAGLPSRCGSSARFSFRLGPHHLRGRVDRVDRAAGRRRARYELIDYKTSRPKTAEQLRDDVQLSLYALAAREDWGLESSRQAYYYVLDDVRACRCRARARRRRRRGHRAGGRRGDPRPGVRADAVARGVLDLRLPDRLPARRRGLSSPGVRRGRLSATSLGPALAQEALEFAREHVAGGDVRGRALLVALGGLLEALDERLDVGVALHGQADLALVVGGGRLELGDVDGDADQPFHAAHQRQRGLRVGGGGDVVGDGGPQARRRAARRPRRRCAARRRCPVGPS